MERMDLQEEPEVTQEVETSTEALEDDGAAAEIHPCCFLGSMMEKHLLGMQHCSLATRRRSPLSDTLLAPTPHPHHAAFPPLVASWHAASMEEHLS